MDEYFVESLHNEMQRAFELTTYVSINKKNLIDIYVNLQYEMYEVEEEAEEEFQNILRDESMIFLGSLRKVESLFKKGMVEVRENESVQDTKVNKIKTFLNLAGGLTVSAENLGTEFVVDVEERIFEIAHAVKRIQKQKNITEEEAYEYVDLDEVEQLKELKGFLDELIDGLLTLATDIEVMMESYDEAEV